jgi:dolichyl-diphosphooligosaccharide--protein glycosyltransferase/undecaprenyl-diphosphooligosaccharide--protein glycosyltransferase
MARDILSGVLEVDAQLVATQGGITAIVTAFFAKVLPFSFETVILYIPAFLGSLLVIPLVLIGYSLKQSYLGFLAALLGSIVWSYYNRTMTGYYDSDMLNIVLPMLVLWGLIHSILTQKDRYLILLVIFMILSQLWYPKNISLNSAMVFMSVIYLVIKDRDNIFNFKLISFAFIGLATFSLILKILLIFSLFVLFHYKSKLYISYRWSLSISLSL